MRLLNWMLVAATKRIVLCSIGEHAIVLIEDFIIFIVDQFEKSP